MNQDRLRSQHVPGRAPQGLLAKALTLALSTTLLIAGFMFSLILLAIVATVLLLLGGWLWWKTRALRRTMRDGPIGKNAPTASSSGCNTVIDGEYVREPASPNAPRVVLHS